MDVSVYDFGAYTLDLEAGELRHDGSRVRVEPRPFELLVYLVRNMGRAVSLSEIRDEVWRGAAGQDSSIHMAISEVRRVVGQARGERFPVETVHRRGYRFVGARASAPDQKRAERLLWRQYAQHAEHGPRTASECIELADRLLRAEVARYGAL